MSQKKKRTPAVYRQGDILIMRVEEIPNKARKLPDQERHIIAEGEATGHHHAIPSVEGLSVFRRGNEQAWLEVKEAPAELVHPEHATIEIPQGNYEIRRQREYDPVKERYVYD